jgi:SAM-dependent methyltransferase
MTTSQQTKADDFGMKTHDAELQFREAVVGMARQGITGERFGMMRRAFASAPAAITRRLTKFGLRKVLSVMPDWVGRSVGMPRLGAVRFGDLGGVKPIGEVFGGNRGRPIDRYYIEEFLARNTDCIRGRVLEIEDNTYTMRFGGSAVARSDVLHLHEGYPGATIFGDMTDPKTLPADAFDCIILTQTLHLLYDMKSGVTALYRALKPGGTLLLTVPGITPIDPGEWGDYWYWSLTEAALRRLLGEQFAAEQVKCTTYGNVLAAITFLAGIATEEVPQQKLDVYDRSFPMIIGGRAVKPVNP